MAFLFTIIFQYLGALLGIFISFLLSKYKTVDIYPTPGLINFNTEGEINYGRIVFQEFLQTFTFTCIYLICHYDSTMR